jgi:hypothetical protein
LVNKINRLLGAEVEWIKVRFPTTCSSPRPRSATSAIRRLRPVVARSAASSKGVRSLGGARDQASSPFGHGHTPSPEASTAAHHTPAIIALMAKLTRPAHGREGPRHVRAPALGHWPSVARPRPSSADRSRPSIPFSAVMARPKKIAHSVELPPVHSPRSNAKASTGQPVSGEPTAVEPARSPSVQRQGFDGLDLPAPSWRPSPSEPRPQPARAMRVIRARPSAVRLDRVAPRFVKA